MSNTINSPGRPVELGGAWGTLAERVGSVNKLAELLGISPRTIQRIARGDYPAKFALQAAVAMLARQWGVESPYKVEIK